MSLAFIVLLCCREGEDLKLRQMAVAFLINEDQEVLFLQKRPKDTFLAGFLVPIGGILKELKSMNQKEHV